MEIIQSEIINQKTIASQSKEDCHSFGCSFHGTSFVVNKSGELYSFQYENPQNIQIRGSVSQLVPACNKDSDSCHVIIRTTSNTVYQWNCYANPIHSNKRMKLNDSDEDKTEVKKITDDIRHIMPYNSSDVILFPTNTNNSIDIYNVETKTFRESTNFCKDDYDITHCQLVEDVEPSIMDASGIIYARNSVVLWRSTSTGLETLQDTELFTLNEVLGEKIILLELIQVPEISNKLNTCLAIGDQGTILLYNKDIHNEGVVIQQFDISGPLTSIIKIKDLTYIASNGSGTLLLELQFNKKDFELRSTPVENGTNLYQLCSVDVYNCIFDALTTNEQSQLVLVRIKYNPIWKSIENDPEAIKALIDESLKELAASEKSLKFMEQKEEELSQQLASTNHTLYALKSIQNKRKLGVINSLDTTGFEFTVRPILKSNSSENCCLQTTAYLRVCIKTSRFLELEQWDLAVDLYSSFTHTGQSKLVSVIGFESQYDHGIERSIVWERDIALDLRELVLPLKVTTALIMTMEQDNEIIRFPLSELNLDDLHFVKPCTPDMQTSIERRGIDEISNKLIKAYNLQVLHDRTRANPLNTLLQRFKPHIPAINSFLFHHKSLHLKYEVDPELSIDKYRSILGTLLCEGLSKQDSQDMLRNGAEHAVFFLAAHPYSPVIIHLSRDMPSIVDFHIQCSYPPAILKVEAALLQRVDDHFPVPERKQNKQGIALLKKLQQLENDIIELQDKYQEQRSETSMDIDDNTSLTGQLMNTIDLYYDVHKNEPIGFLHIP